MSALPDDDRPTILMFIVCTILVLHVRANCFRARLGSGLSAFGMCQEQFAAEQGIQPLVRVCFSPHHACDTCSFSASQDDPL